MLSHIMSNRGSMTNRSQLTVMPTGMHYPPTTRSVMVDVHYTVSAGQSSTRPTNNSTSHPSGPMTSPFQDLYSENGIGSIDQTELSHYGPLYSQAHEDLDKLKDQAQRRSI